MILQKHVLSFKCNDFFKMANLKAISSSATLSISSFTSDCKIGAKKNEPLILSLKYRLKQDLSFSIFQSKLQPTLLKKSLKASAIARFSVIFLPFTCRDDILLLTLLELFSIGPKCFHRFLAELLLSLNIC